MDERRDCGREDHPGVCPDKSCPDSIRAHAFSSGHKASLEKDRVCGCFYCLKIFHPAQFRQWIIADNPCDREGTAVCPYCGVDAIIGESSGFPVTEAFLGEMRMVWF